MTDDRRPAPPRRGIARLFRTALVLIPIGVLGNVAFSYATTDRSVLHSLADRPKSYLLLAAVLGVTPWFTNALRVLIWTRFLGYRLSFRDAFEMSLATDLGSAVAPTAVGGGIFKWGLLVQHGVSPGAAASITTFPIVEDGIFFLLALPFALIFSESLNLPLLHDVGLRLRENAFIVFGVAALIGILSWLAIRWVLGGGLGHRTRSRGLKIFARLRRKMRTTWRDAREVFQIIIRRGKLLFLLSLSITAIQWAARYSVVTAIIAYLGAPVHPVLYWLLQWVVFTFMALTPTPGGAGGAEASFYLIYSAFVPRDVIGLATAGWRFLTFYFELGLASILFFIFNLTRRGSKPKLF
jgi:uncharacterized protein (TIRG00374 family)